MYVSSASFAYPRLDGSARARVAGLLTGAKVPPGVFVLSTCLRVEVAVSGDANLLSEALTELFGDSRPASPEIRTGVDAARHLFSVAAGLESPVVGEVEILTQFRQALAPLRHSGAADGGFLKLLESAVATGRDFRAELGTSPHDTMAALAAQMVGSEARVAVIGSGTMAKAVVGALAGLPAPPEITVVARSPEKVTINGVTVVSMEHLESVLADFGAIVSATAASTQLIEPDRLRRAVSQSDKHPTLVDMAMPPDFVTPPDGPVRYVSIDDLAEMAAQRPRITEGWQRVLEAAESAYDRLAGPHTGPVIASMLAGADAVVADAVSRFSGRLNDPSDRDVLLQAAHTVARKLMNGPVTAVRSSRDPQLLEALSAVFADE